MTEHVEVVVVGAGFAGLAAAWRLLDAGVTGFAVLERADEVGGTWLVNRYPGAACDIRSDLYSLSFAPNPDWRRTFGTRSEILEYLIGVSRKRGIRDHIRFGTECTAAVWDDTAALWRISTPAGDMTADVLLLGHGPFSEPHWPAIEGLGTFAGTLLHSSAWPADAGLAGTRVAVVGTGASAIQIVPALQREVTHLTVFQRSAAWIIPRRDRPTSARRRRLFRVLPAAQRAVRDWIFRTNDLRWFAFRYRLLTPAFAAIAGAHRRAQVADEGLRAALSPDYRIGCKRVLVSDDFYPAVARPNVDLETTPIARVTAEGVVTADGRLHEVDAIVCATGFDVARPAIAGRITGRTGGTLADAWRRGAYALRGSAVPGFPNLFLLDGPNAGIAHNSLVAMIEVQVEYAVGGVLAIRDAARARGVQRPVAEAAAAPTDAYERSVRRLLAASVWERGGCTSYYLDPETGRNTALWPLRGSRFRAANARFDPTEYAFG